jgi:hypothetical protein
MLNRKRIHLSLLSVFFFAFVGLFQQCAPAKFGALDSAYGKTGEIVADDDGKKVDDLARGDDDGDDDNDEEGDDVADNKKDDDKSDDKKDVADKKDESKKDESKSQEMTCAMMMKQYAISLQVPCNRGKSKICVPTHKPHPTQAGRCIAEKLTPLESIKGILNGNGGHVIGPCNGGLKCPDEGA